MFILDYGVDCNAAEITSKAQTCDAVWRQRAKLLKGREEIKEEAKSGKVRAVKQRRMGQRDIT